MLQQALLDAPKFGNDNEEADEIAVRLHEFICQTIRNQKNRTRLDSFLAVLINNNMNVTLGQFNRRDAGRQKMRISFCPTATALTTDRIKRD